jgi:hypothetical protein
MMIDPNSKTEAGDFLPLAPASGPGAEGESRARSTPTGLSVAPPMPAGSAAAVIGNGFPDDGRAPERSDADDERIALHEASHAVVGRLLGQPLGGATIVPCGEFGGLCWGPTFQSRFAGGPSTPTICAKLEKLMPGPGESRDATADLVLHAHTRVVELVAGTEGERMFCDGEPWFAADDERQAFALASLVTSSPAAAAAFIEFARVEAVSLLAASAHIVRALAKELRIKRTMDGAAIDRCIEQAVAAKAATDERQRRLEWQRIERSAGSFADLTREGFRYRG